MSVENHDKKLFAQFSRLVIRGSLLIVFCVLLAMIYLPFSDSIDKMFEFRSLADRSLKQSTSNQDLDPNRIENGIHMATGMIYDENFQLVKNSCTSCHSAKLITQNRATREGWEQMIRWMQNTQGLPDLGRNEIKILDYLAKNYSPEDTGRRPELVQEEIEWYVLDIE